MGLLDDIRADLTEAMKAKDKLTVSTLRSVVAAVQEAEVAGSAATTLDDKQIQKVIAAQAKRRVEAAEAFEQGDRAEKAADERAELSVLEQYLPQQLPENALVEIVERVMAEGGYSTMADMGEAMKAVNGEVAGRAEGRVVADLVKSRLS
ncbi:MAG: glutamyl-tRNA amidotransferase [Acidimicrobiaceae bacterium]|nr:glutamyl-tRNA amidotransferase [Acidimicrobiaceae bacterium]|tara:strand:+ start:300 stop:749 length:450 start_codon:yes stop_codon:yes gene_type:complete